MKVVRYYRYPGCSAAALEKLLGTLQRAAGDKLQISNVQAEVCIYIQIKKGMVYTYEVYSPCKATVRGRTKPNLQYYHHHHCFNSRFSMLAQVGRFPHWEQKMQITEPNNNLLLGTVSTQYIPQNTAVLFFIVFGLVDLVTSYILNINQKH